MLHCQEANSGPKHHAGTFTFDVNNALSIPVCVCACAREGSCFFHCNSAHRKRSLHSVGCCVWFPCHSTPRGLGRCFCKPLCQAGSLPGCDLLAGGRQHTIALPVKVEVRGRQVAGIPFLCPLCNLFNYSTSMPRPASPYDTVLLGIPQEIYRIETSWRTIGCAPRHPPRNLFPHRCTLLKEIFFQLIVGPINR